MTFQELQALGISPVAVNSAFIPNAQDQQHPSLSPDPEILAMLSSMRGQPQDNEATAPAITPEMLSSVLPLPQNNQAAGNIYSILKGVGMLPTDGNPPAPSAADLASLGTAQGGGQQSVQPPSVNVHVYGGSTPSAPLPADVPAASGNDERAFPDFYTWAAQRGYQKGQQVLPAEKLGMLKLYEEARMKDQDQNHPQFIQAPNGANYVRLGNTLLAVPAQRGVSTEEKTLPDGRVVRYVTDSSSPDYMAAQAVYDKSTGQQIVTGPPDQAIQDQRNASQQTLSDLKNQAADLTQKIASGQKVPWYSAAPSYEQQLAGLKAKYDQLQNQSISVPASDTPPNATPQPPNITTSPQGIPPAASQIREAYRAGQIDKAKAAEMLRQLHLPSIK